ncbi:hypothetical protein GCM10009798_28100 [Nocardioides panacihumi]|uniref:WD40 repeat domain-containing protein n=1 Tax=Nocardioides panacihumi TaxID=400774 RepID=A0ABN2RAU1_9ACTN
MNDIKDALTRIADGSAPDRLSLEHVQGRARQIRRRRTATAIIGSAATVAVIAGLGVAVMPSSSHRGAVPPATQSVSPSPTTAGDANAVGPVHHVKLDVPAEQTFGSDPQVPYWSQGQIIDTDGTATPLPDRPFTFAKDPVSGGWVVVRVGEAHAEMVRIDAKGALIGKPVPTFEHGLAVGPDGQLTTLTQAQGHWTLTVGQDQVSLGRTIEWAAIKGFTPKREVVLDIDGAARLADAYNGIVTDLPGAATAVPSSAYPLTAIGREDGTWVAQREDGTTQWGLDWAGVNSFSPDGRYVALVGDPQHRIAGSADWDSEHATSTIWVRTAADLLPVAAFVAPDGGYFWSWTWDGDDLLATVFLKGQWSLVRLSPDGFTVGRATAQPGGGEAPAYVFGAH